MSSPASTHNHISCRTLFLNLASHDKCIALVEGEKTLVLERVEDHTDEGGLMKQVVKLMNEKGEVEKKTSNKKQIPNCQLSIVNCQLVDRIAVVTGPGGFMTLRVAVSLANALSWSLKIPLAGIHLSDLWKHRVSSASQSPVLQSPIPNSCLWLHSTKRDLLFIRGFGEYEKHWTAPTIITLIDLKKKFSVPNSQFPIRFIGDLIPEHLTALAGGKRLEPASLDICLPLLLNTLEYQQKTLVPWYGRGV